MQRLPLTVQNAYSDLLDRLLDDAILETGGTPVLRTIRGRSYWYARSYVGDEEKEKYLGPDTPAFRDRVDRLQEQIAGLRERQAGRRPLVQVLRVKGVPRIDAATGKVLQALARAGVFRLRGVLVGEDGLTPWFEEIRAGSLPRTPGAPFGGERLLACAGARDPTTAAARTRFMGHAAQEIKNKNLSQDISAVLVG